MKIANAKVLVLLFASVSFSANAATAIVTNVQTGTADTLYADSTGTLLDGGIVSIGYFSAGFDVNANIADQSALVTDFTVLTSALAGSPSPNLGGSFPGFVEQAATTDFGTITGANQLLGRQLYSFIGNQATLLGSSEVALVLLQTIADDVPTPNDYNSNPSSLTPTIGTVGSFTGNASGFGNATQPTIQTVQLVPEPSTLLLSAFGVLGLLRRKR